MKCEAVCVEAPRKTRPRLSEEIAWALAGRVVHLRSQRERFLSQSDLAHEAGVDPKVIKCIERGAGNPTLSVLEGIAAALDVPVSELLS